MGSRKCASKTHEEIFVNFYLRIETTVRIIKEDFKLKVEEETLPPRRYIFYISTETILFA